MGLGGVETAHCFPQLLAAQIVSPFSDAVYITSQHR